MIFMFSLSCGMKGQSTNNISIGALYSELSGLNTELSYSKLIAGRIGLTARAAYNYHESYSLRGGIFYRLLKHQNFGLDFGLEYSYDRHKFNDFADEVTSHNLNLPLTLGYKFSESFGLYGGLSGNINFNNSESNRVIDILRLGIQYNW